MQLVEQLCDGPIKPCCAGLVNYLASASNVAGESHHNLPYQPVSYHASQGVPQKQKQLLEELRKLADHSRNYLEYRTRLRNTQPPAVPFLGM
jgi:hypothetical protein